MIHTSRRAVLLLAAIFIAAAPTVSEAQDGPSFPAGTWSAQLYGSAAVGEKGEIFGAQGGVGYHFKDNMSINFEAVGGHIDSDVGPNASLSGLDLLFRWHFLDAPNWTVFFDGGAGIQKAEHRFPDTHSNFRPQVGFGGTLRLAEELRLIGGVRWLHISNAGRTNANPGYDGAMGYVGLMMSF